MKIELALGLGPLTIYKAYNVPEYVKISDILERFNAVRLFVYDKDLGERFFSREATGVNVLCDNCSYILVTENLKKTLDSFLDNDANAFETAKVESA